MLAADEFHTPSLSDFFPEAVLFKDSPYFQLNRITIMRVAIAVLVAAVFALGMRNAKLVPRGLQSVVESMLDFVRVNIAEEILGKENGRKYMVLISSIFFATVFLNLPSIIPFLNISPNARIGMPIVMAAAAYIAYVGVGMRKYGVFGFIKSSIVIPGVPMAIQPLLIPIEFVSTFILRPFTLTVRLMANMLAGHIMLVLFFAATQYFLFSGTWHVVFAPFSLIAGIGFTFFELMIIVLQAYIFALLTAVYIDLSLHADQH
ncbi:ATP synthase subunit a [Gordonia hirsuta DSM 44140 = NBRC 16056]|uniref:ATP synthase subunit a n=1 Tax=Gordonia hirsuta DSM 44140 = NBRC 16056 TaxID=1121927 RepID=L7L7T2_9ACTN|nr:F0F1 ATP synthase subunit A [Gordonia hirsuta]GAC56816.1 ATP synthase subunit a [Gordonia hirsuta DSM 44140 = NBRC 16056]